MHDFQRGTIAILVGETANTSISIEQSYVVFSSHDHRHWNTFNSVVSWKACKLKFISCHKNVKNIDMFFCLGCLFVWHCPMSHINLMDAWLYVYHLVILIAYSFIIPTLTMTNVHLYKNFVT
jgi:hypothetical protein